MVLDTSALLAILQGEPQRRAFSDALQSAGSRSMSVVSFVECSIVLAARRGPEAVRDLDLLIAKADIALAQTCGEPLLCKGAEFSLTDVVRHPASG